MRRYIGAQNHELSAAAMPGRNSPAVSRLVNALKTKPILDSLYCPGRLAFLALDNLFLQFESAMRIKWDQIAALCNNMHAITFTLSLNYYASTAFSEYIPMLKHRLALHE